MATKPTDQTDWATQQQTDPVSGQLNRLEPPQSYKDGGWSRQEIPPRQYWNWMLWKIGQWVTWLAAGTSSATASTVMERDSNGRTQVVDPSVDADAANKGYVESSSGDVSPTADTLVRRGASSEVNAGRFKDAVTPGNGDFDSDKFPIWQSGEVSLGGFFDASASIFFTRIGNIVYVTSSGNLAHSSSDAVLSESGVNLIPSWAEFDSDYVSDGKINGANPDQYFNFRIENSSSGGEASLLHYDPENFILTPTTGTSAEICITYRVSPSIAI